MTVCNTHLLGPAGLAWHSEMADAYDFSTAEAQLLLQAAATIDTLSGLSAAIAKLGYVDSSGEVQPAVREHRLQAAALAKLLAALRLGEDTEAPAPRRRVGRPGSAA